MTFEEAKQQAIDRYATALATTQPGPRNVIEECLADFAENNELEFYENGICVRHR